MTRIAEVKRKIAEQKQLQKETTADWSYWAYQSTIEKLERELEVLENESQSDND